MNDDTITFTIVVGLIACLVLGLVIGNISAKTGRGVGIMSGDGTYKYVNVPSELKFKSVNYEFSPSNGFINILWEPTDHR